ncbi:hypothetical protein [Caloramator sp. Dgby_cultured_2]|uniref:hypothetical protein n=1 Tax=Caloramator sp. Dgby_cultured_2 TaxID=3029174 RepID=UPI00237D98EA|nr:hypothetical protein [Caloramator sp. Dgby_cultured_2]WDU83917.1 hypothetical protein PWK10_05375 [Caloramator sp. Dgby_cultured_2]
MISRVFYLQVVNGEYYRTLAEEKGRKFINEIAPRGEILDRNGNKLATNVQSFNITYNNVKSKADNDEINKVLLDTIRLIIKNGDEQKINTPNFPIVYENGIFKFDFGSSEKEINKKRNKI